MLPSKDQLVLADALESLADEIVMDLRGPSYHADMARSVVEDEEDQEYGRGEDSGLSLSEKLIRGSAKKIRQGHPGEITELYNSLSRLASENKTRAELSKNLQHKDERAKRAYNFFLAKWSVLDASAEKVKELFLNHTKIHP